MKYRKQPCEVCAADDWQVLGRRTYVSSAIKCASDYEKKRLLVLFERWFPGCLAVELEWLCCVRCGFVMYSPRPEESDIDEKYRFLEELGQDAGQLCASSVEQRRSELLWRYLRRRVDLAGVRSVLDYGGGDGHLMRAFRENGMSCSLVDYSRNCAPGMVKLADTIDRVPAECIFDLIICNHVIEHVADPLRVVKTLIRHLRNDGHLFVEVPMEMWKRVPSPREPVTHINFFTPNSMWNLIRLAGVQTLRSELTEYLHPHDKWLPCVRALATPGVTTTSRRSVMRSVDVNKYIHPDLCTKMRYYSANRRALLRVVARRPRPQL